MKTAISIPDEVFAQAEQVARSKGFTRSELFTQAVIYYIKHKAFDENDKIQRINDLLAELGDEAFGQPAEISRAQLNALGDEGW